MNNTHGRLVVILAKIIGVVLVVIAISMVQDVWQLKAVSENDVFHINGRVQFLEQKGERFWDAKRVLVQIENYPVTFFIDNKGKTVSATLLSGQVKLTDTVRVAVQKDQLPLLYTRSELRVYGIFLQNRKAVYSYNDAFQRDKKERWWLYVQAVICFFGGVILVFLPKKYLIKD